MILWRTICSSFVQKNGELFEQNLLKDIDHLIHALEKKKQELVTFIHEEVDRKISLIHQQYSSYNAHIQQTTGFLQFSIEALKESDPYAYLQVCYSSRIFVALLGFRFPLRYVMVLIVNAHQFTGNSLMNMNAKLIRHMSSILHSIRIVFFEKFIVYNFNKSNVRHCLYNFICFAHRSINKSV